MDSLRAPAEILNSQGSSHDAANDTIDSPVSNGLAEDTSPADVDTSDVISLQADETPNTANPLDVIDPVVFEDHEETGTSADKEDTAETIADEDAAIERTTDEAQIDDNIIAKEVDEQPPEGTAVPEDGEAATTDENTGNGAKDLEQIKLQHQNEIHEYVERIDSLESKLQYLSRSAADISKDRASSTPAGSTERTLAEKDEKIALLMEEGQKLAVGEQKYRSIIKKLRLQIADGEKQSQDLRKEKEKAFSDAESLRNQLSGNAEKEKRQEGARKATAGLQKTIDALKKEKAGRDETITRLEKDLREKTELADKADSLTKTLASERAKLKTLENNHAALAAEKDAAVEKGRHETIEWRGKLDRAAERGKAVEAELRTELHGMEAKLETMRARAEEVTSGSGGEAQVKLLRQIETLQSQYASASNNWQGMETTLLAKISNLENERDDAARRESEMRKKAREAVSTPMLPSSICNGANCEESDYPCSKLRGRIAGYPTGAGKITRKP